MKVLIVLAHPEPQSFNAAMYRTAVQAVEAAGHEVKVSDLNQQAFYAVSDRSNFKSAKDAQFLKLQLEETYATSTRTFSPGLEAEIQKVEWCDLMIWQFPLWWFGLPAILKGWVDRVFAMGRAYGDGHVYEHGLFRGKKALLSLTTGGGVADYESTGLNGDMQGILRPIHRGILEFTGFEVLQPQLVYGPARLTEEERRRELDNWTSRLQQITTETAIQVGMY
ncbi:NAD(P)H-dependent oxidoreductase [Chitinophaga pendula]|uniref:NAD(P)H-dependent oxidoreductase n=1 Tax=Chitinophaga TaxID=79328 RepID=UPI000BB07FD2|nr:MULTISPECIES: NAD(P)H-dependent oxidoreductase [Chitinophaga]ASZ14174.1 NADPH quinone oxidoreductase [Chitinophaga sp. MD30]UCJ08190.1 NAD(P)H-dependent oxidoreductase [Chitinophaga pendula]